MVKKSPFPPGFLGVDLFYDNTWNSVGADTLDGDLNQTGVAVRHGASSEGGKADVSSLGFTVRNGDGKYSPRNPSSPLYGKIGRNTPARATVGLGAAYALLPGGVDSAYFYNSASDTATPGDIDVRWWGEFEISQTTDVLIRKGPFEGNRAWSLNTDQNGNLVLWWYPTAAGAGVWAQSSAPIPAWAGEIALRATLQLNNGAGGYTVKFYYATSLDGPWKIFGTTIGSAPTTMHNSTGSIGLRSGLLAANAYADQKVYGFEVRNGIGDAAPVMTTMRFDRAVPGYARGDTALRFNWFFDPTPGGPVAVWNEDTVARSGAIQDPTHGKVIELTKKTTAAAWCTLAGKAFPFGVNTVLKVSFDVLYEGPVTTGVNFMYRPLGTTTGEKTVAANLQNYTSWTRVNATVDTGTTAPGAGAGFGVRFPALPAGTRVLIRNMVITQGTETTPFSGDSTNTTTRFYHWLGGVPYTSPSVEYGTIPWVAFTDGMGRRWMRNNGSGPRVAEVTNRHVVGVGEVAEWPIEWGTKGAPSVMTAVEASGITRRLGQGQPARNSAFYNGVMALPSKDLLAYWPMEEEGSPNRFNPAIGRWEMTWTGGTPPQFASYDGLPGSKPMAKFGSSAIKGTVRQVANWTASAVQVRGLFHFPPAAVSTDTVLWSEKFLARTPSGIARVDLLVSSSGGLKLIGYDSDDVLKNETLFVGFDVFNKNVRISVELVQSATLEITPRISTLNPAYPGGGLTYDYPTWTGRSLWPIDTVTLNPARASNLGEVAVGHVTVENKATSIHAVSAQVMTGYANEDAEDRFRRLAAEKTAPVSVQGFTDKTPAMGPQPIETWLNSLAEVEAADGGLLHDDVTKLGLRYRTYRSLCTQPATVINYVDNLVQPFDTLDDDAMTRNQVTRNRLNGNSYTAARDDGPLSTAPYPAGVGVYESSEELNVANDLTLLHAANWDMHTGTWDEARYPTLGVDLAHPVIKGDPILTRELLSMRPGDRLVINNPPSWLPPFAVDVLVMGTQLDVTPWSARLTFVCVPARPWNVGYYNTPDHRYSGEGTALSGAVTSTATTLPLSLPANVVWTIADGPYDILVGGEVMRVTNVTGGNSLTVVRSVNGVVKAHSSGALVKLAAPSFYSK